jgi:hypothetical protein
MKFSLEQSGSWHWPVKKRVSRLRKMVELLKTDVSVETLLDLICSRLDVLDYLAHENIHCWVGKGHR